MRHSCRIAPRPSTAISGSSAIRRSTRWRQARRRPRARIPLPKCQPERLAFSVDGAATAALHDRDRTAFARAAVATGARLVVTTELTPRWAARSCSRGTRRGRGTATCLRAAARPSSRPGVATTTRVGPRVSSGMVMTSQTTGPGHRQHGAQVVLAKRRRVVELRGRMPYASPSA